MSVVETFRKLTSAPEQWGDATSQGYQDESEASRQGRLTRERGDHLSYPNHEASYEEDANFLHDTAELGKRLLKLGGFMPEDIRRDK